MSGVRAALRVGGFRSLLSSYVLNRGGDVVGALALAVIVLAKSGSALATALLFLATQFVPGLVGPLLSARVERIAPGRLLPRLYLIECALFALLAVTVNRLAIGAIVTLALADATLAFAARAVTRSAAASMLMPADLMPEGKAAFNVALAAAMIAGPVLGGLAITLVGARAALAIDACSFLLAAAVIAAARALRATPATSREAAGSTVERVREGLGYLSTHPALRALILGEGLAFVFFYLVVPVTVVYASDSLHAGAGGYAAILASWGAGIAIGSAIQVRIARRVGVTTILASTAGVAIGYLGTAAAPTLVLACAASVIGGIGNGTQWASVETTIHQLVEEAFRARAAAVLESLAAIAPGAGILLGGVLSATMSPRAAYLAAGLGLVALVALGAAGSWEISGAPAN